MNDEFLNEYRVEGWKKRDGDTKKRPNNEYVKSISTKEALEFLENAGPVGNRYNTLKESFELNWEDFRTEQAQEVKLRKEEKFLQEGQAMLAAAKLKAQNDPSKLTEDEQEALKGLSEEQISKALEGVREQRIKVQRRKEEFSILEGNLSFL